MIKATFQEKFSVEEQETAPSECDRVRVKLAFRFKNSEKVEFEFLSAQPTQVLYEYAFAHGSEYRPFVIFKAYPHEQIPCSKSLTISETGVEGLLSVESELADGLVDPITLVEEGSQEPVEKEDSNDLDVLKQGLGRRPIVHTCSYISELPATYQSYQEFASDFKAVLNDTKFVWIMDGI